MSFILGISLLIVLIVLMVFVVKSSAVRKNRSVKKWLIASFLLPFLPFILFFLPPVPAEAEGANEKRDDEETEENADTNSEGPLFIFAEYSIVILLAILEIFLIWSLNNWISQPWGKDDPDFVYDKRLLAPASADSLKSANEFLEAFFHPDMTGEPISMPEFKASKTEEHCQSLCGYSGICDQIKLLQCIHDYKRHYEAVSSYVKHNYAYPWTKPMLRSLAQSDDREGVLDYGKLSEQLNESHKAFETLQEKYEAHKVDPLLLAAALQEPMKETGVPDFVKSEKLYKKELRFYR